MTNPPVELRHAGKVANLTIEANTSPCVNTCRYCFVGDRDETFAKFPVKRWMDFVQRFLDWKERVGDCAPKIQHGFPGPAFNFDLDTYCLLNAWHQRRFDKPITGIMLGGLKMRPAEEIRAWLAERYALGLRNVHASFSGLGANHDRWVGKRGEFNFLLNTFRIAAELGIECATTLFLTKSSPPEMERLANTLDALTPNSPMFKHVRLVYYMGNGAHQEHERITEDDREHFPPFIAEAVNNGFEIHSEREWIPIVLGGTESEPFIDMFLTLKLTPQNIDRLDSMSCEAIIAEMEAERRTYEERIPTFKWLAEHCADRNGKRLYMKFDIFKLWRERYIEATQMQVPRPFMNKTLRPPRLRDVAWYATVA